MNIITKKNVLLSSGLLVLVWIFEVFISPLDNVCANQVYCANIADNVGTIIFFFAPVVFTLSLVTCFLRDVVFILWARIMLLWIIVASIVIIFTPHNLHGGLFATDTGKPFIALLSAGLLMIISLLIITFKSIQLRRKK